MDTNIFAYLCLFITAPDPPAWTTVVIFCQKYYKDVLVANNKVFRIINANTIELQNDSTESSMCPVFEMSTIVFVIAFVLVMFWYCFNLQAKSIGRPSNFVVDPNLLSPDTSGNVRYTCASPLLKSEHMDHTFQTVKPEDLPEVFHKPCIMKWFLSNQHRTCPVCRSCQLPASRLLVITILPQNVSQSQRPYRISQVNVDWSPIL
ncbi:hypothetical protein FSP39_024919 [Pinctada imbricata]|uniref:RING-type domain-containing protein n=1 Tax=Pinctada imbricata TaxID=66713 RepID=A0AA88YID5_PINIB|nr:hypothetical protein FSP39_024919 [Pinctada imbricata]